MFEKNGWQNRNRIKNNQGWQWLTVPVQHKAEQLIKDTLLNTSEKWARKHWQALLTGYSKAANFKQSAEIIEELYRQDWASLEAVNMAFIRTINGFLEIDTPIIDSSDLKSEGKASSLLINICKELNCDHYLAGPGGKDYMDLELFEKEGISIIWQGFHSIEYPQTYPQAGFVENLSMLDAVFNLGKDARRIIE